MPSRFSRRVYSCAFAIAMIAGHSPSASAADPTIKVAFWNIMSGKGVEALDGHAAPFRNVANCADPSQPLNAWGVGVPQAAMAALAADPTVVALGLAESWSSVCGSPENVRQALGWAAHTTEQNGVALVARYGLAGPEQWLQLDTTHNNAPGDTAWVLRAPVCLDAPCSQSMPVYVTHWYATGSSSAATYDKQAQQTVSFLSATSNSLPHVLVGDFNAWEGTGKVCNQSPNNTSLPYLRGAGYVDAWTTVHGGAEGYTGMANRNGCGYPMGYAWKRIDYVWTLPSFQPLDIQRFGMLAPGDAAPSDHYGLVATFPHPYAATTTPPPPPAPAPAPSSAWTSLVKAVVTGATLQKSSGCGDCFDAGAIGTQPITAGGSASFSVTAGHRLFVGLGSDMTASTSYAIDYAFSFWPSGTWEIREKNVYKKEGGFTAADQFRIAVEGTTVKYYKNDVLIHASATAATTPLVVDTSLASLGAAVHNLTTTVPGATPPVPPAAPSATPGAPAAVVWSALANAAVIGSDLRKTAGCGECYDAGGVSQQQIGAAGGSVSFSISTGHRLVVGLGRDTSPNASFAVDYAFSFYENGTWDIREHGAYRREGASGAGDVFKIAVEAGAVKYYRNGALVYTSLAAVTGPLVVDSSLHTIGAAISNATMIKSVE